MSADAAELLNDAFKAAALSVTKLYKISTSTQAKARADGYQDCLEDLVAFLDRGQIGHAEGSEGWWVRRWLSERLDGREQMIESEDETDKTDNPASSPPMDHRANSVAPVPPPTLAASTTSPKNNQQQGGNDEVHMLTNRDSATPPTVAATTTAGPVMVVEDADIQVPTQENFTFQSHYPYPPQDSYMNLANLDLSDGQSQSHTSSNNSAATPRAGRGRSSRTASRTTMDRIDRIRAAGQKRKYNLAEAAEIFDLANLGFGNGKDVFGNGGGKRSRHT
ncbi:hypothetical protein B0T17DRAFT_582823 [Bombardia bombarda]|uniref:Uncharacterized protein n=1 Tax=Bombardia bombarda TaxID=252184 RepID=A0AA39WGM7_9PEZI|nr:hypothetical protein B0T17DRAFT_582823 [Bombardia bombarda]